MARSHNENLATALEKALKISVANVVMAAHLNPRDKTLLIKEGYLRLIIKGWYLLDANNEGGGTGESVLWYEGLWNFLSLYLADYIGENYWLSQEYSLKYMTGDCTLPTQLVIYNSVGKNHILKLPKDISVVISHTDNKPVSVVKEVHGINSHSLESALGALMPKSYASDKDAIVMALQQANITVLAGVLSTTLNKDSASRLIGAYSKIGMQSESESLQTQFFQYTNFHINGIDPFEIDTLLHVFNNDHDEAPVALRIRAMWARMKLQLDGAAILPEPLRNFWETPIKETIDSIEGVYISDSYNSLSIEGYKVTEDLIKRIRSNDWDPALDSEDNKTADALAAKGYNQAFNTVTKIISNVHSAGISNLDIKKTVEQLVTTVHNDLFSPMVIAQIVKPLDIAGYRKGSVYIRGSRHAPPDSAYLMDCMSALFDLLKEEECSYASAIIGHLCLAYIHPYGDGNGRTSRFLMNTLLILSGNDWVVIPVKKRNDYMASLESASVGKDILPFARFVSEL